MSKFNEGDIVYYKNECFTVYNSEVTLTSIKNADGKLSVVDTDDLTAEVYVPASYNGVKFLVSPAISLDELKQRVDDTPANTDEHRKAINDYYAAKQQCGRGDRETTALKDNDTRFGYIPQSERTS